MKELGVTLVSGFVRVGKSTLLRHIQSQPTNHRMAVLPHAEDLPPLLQSLAGCEQYDYLLLEVPATVEPKHLAEAMTPTSSNTTIRLDTLVTVVDARTFLEDYSRSDFLAERGLAKDGDDRAVVDLLVAQIEFANVIVLNKIDLVRPELADLIAGLLRRFNPMAEVVMTTQGQVAPEKILNTRLYRWKSAEEAAAAMEDAQGAETTTPDAHGLSTFVYQSRRPFHPERFNQVIETPHQGLLRVRGIFWLCSRMAVAGRIDLAGASGRIQSAGYWLAALPDEEAQADPAQWQAAQAIWDKDWGDRRQDLVCIGLKLDHAALRASLDSALLTDAEMKQRPAAWAVYPDPFGEWDSPEEKAGDED